MASFSASTVDPNEALAITRASLQRVAEHVLSKARYLATGRIGLRPTPAGIGTPPFPSPVVPGAERQLRIDGTDLVVRDGDTEVRAPLTTIRATAELVGIEAGAPAEVYTPHTALDLDAPLVLVPEQVARIADWYALTADALERLRVEHEDLEPSIVQLWPEHFDVACAIGEVNYGGSPGDDDHPVPYLYVGPFSPPPMDGEFWNEPFGASFPEDKVLTIDDALSFYHEAMGRLAVLATSEN